MDIRNNVTELERNVLKSSLRGPNRTYPLNTKPVNIRKNKTRKYIISVNAIANVLNTLAKPDVKFKYLNVRMISKTVFTAYNCCIVRYHINKLDVL